MIIECQSSVCCPSTISLNNIDLLLNHLVGIHQPSKVKISSYLIYNLGLSERKKWFVWLDEHFLDHYGPGPVVQLVPSLTSVAEVASSIPSPSHTFVEIEYEIVFTVILLLPLIQEGL